MSGTLQWLLNKPMLTHSPKIESHYFVNGGFFSHPSQLLDDINRIRQIPATIVQGRYDVVCPATGMGPPPAMA